MELVKEENHLLSEKFKLTNDENELKDSKNHLIHQDIERVSGS